MHHIPLYKPTTAKMRFLHYNNKMSVSPLQKQSSPQNVGFQIPEDASTVNHYFHAELVRAIYKKPNQINEFSRVKNPCLYVRNG